jgi:glycosyltransferase involved in cell wall biosynthesis
VKILYLTDRVSVHNQRFLEKLVLAGHEICFWNLAANQPVVAPVPSGVRSIQCAKNIATGAAPSQYRDILPQLQSVLREFQPALVHAGPIQSAGYLAALADFHPLLLMSWGSDLLVDAEREPEWQQATQFALQKADAFFCDCETVRKAADRYRVFSDSQIVQFPWGVKPGLFSPSGPLPAASAFTPKPGKTTFIYTRSWSHLYGTDVLVAAFQRAHLFNSSLRLLLVGADSQAQSIREFLKAGELNHAVSIIGPQPTEELPKWFRAADAYISCAKSDGTSISLLEAMATGLPVLVTDIPSNREWVQEPDNGCLAFPGSPDEVAHKMLRIARLTAQQRKEISERNRRVVAERADWDKNFPRLLEMYNRLV